MGLKVIREGQYTVATASELPTPGTRGVRKGDTALALDTGVLWGAQASSWVALASDLPLTTRGDLLVRGASGLERLPVGNNGQVVMSNGTDTIWGSVRDAGASVAPIYSSAAARPAAAASYAGAAHYATDTTATSLCVRTGPSSYAWVTIPAMP